MLIIVPLPPSLLMTIMLNISISIVSTSSVTIIADVPTTIAGIVF